MIIGQRNESVEEKNKRHIKEMVEEIEGWKNELDFAKKKCDENYKDYCITMIKICENTITSLEDFASKHFTALCR